MGHKPNQADAPPEVAGGPASEQYIRGKILQDHLVRSARHLSVEHGGRSLSDGLAYASAIPVPHIMDSTDAGVTSSRPLPGGLSEEDLSRFGTQSLRLTNAHQNQLRRELHNTLSSIADLYYESDHQDPQHATELSEHIRFRRERIEREHRLAEKYRDDIIQLVQNVNQLHPKLEEELIDALSTLPPILAARHTAEADLLSTTIEASLMKLSLIRTRTHLAVYGHTSPNRPQATMGRALAAAVEKLRTKEHAQAEEEGELDAQLSAYESMLGLVGGREGGFAQVVEDMARVKRETEECKKDLRRLGWTGD